MPRAYAMNTLPEPNDPSVQLRALPPTRFAERQFSGLAGKDDVAAKTVALEKLVKTHNRRAIGPASLARYDPPWTCWFMRRNVEARQRCRGVNVWILTRSRRGKSCRLAEEEDAVVPRPADLQALRRAIDHEAIARELAAGSGAAFQEFDGLGLSVDALGCVLAARLLA